MSTCKTIAAVTDGIDVAQIIYALERQANDLQRFAEKLMRERDYSASFPAGDAARMREAVQILRRVSQP
jgi:hypothetical protein